MDAIEQRIEWGAKRQKNYRQFSRFIARELSVSALFLRFIYAIALHKNLAGHRLPLANNSYRGLMNLYQNLVNGSNLVLDYLWSPAFLGLLAYDLARYYKYPDLRYGVTLEDIFLGTANGEEGPSFSSNLGSNLPTDPHYFLGPAILLSTWITSMLTYAIYRRGWHSIPDSLSDQDVIRISPLQANAILMHDIEGDQNGLLQPILGRIANMRSNPILKAHLLSCVVHALNPYELERFFPENAATYSKLRVIALSALEKFKKLPSRQHTTGFFLENFLASLYAKYRLWGDGEAVFTSVHLLYFLSTAFFLYAKIRFFELLVYKAKESWTFDAQACACDAEHLAWQYMEMVGDYLCTVCGDWDFVSFKTIHNASACLNALVSQPFNASSMITGLARFSNASNITAIELGRLGWRGWAVTDLEIFLGNLSEAVSGTLRQLSLATPQYVENIPDAAVLAFGMFFNVSALNSLNLSYLGLTEAQLGMLFSSISSSLFSLFLSGMQLTDAEFIQILHYVNGTAALTDLDMSHNQLSDFAIQQLSIALFVNLQRLNLANNAFGPSAYPFLSKILRECELRFLNITGNQLGDAAAQVMGDAITNASTVGLSMANMMITDMQLQLIARGVSNSSVSFWDLGQNAISPMGVAVLMQSLVDSEMATLILSNNMLGDDGLLTIGGMINQTNLTTITLVNTGLTGDAFDTLVNTSTIAQPLALDFSQNPLDDAGIIALAEWISGGGLLVRALCLNNIAASGDALAVLLQALPDTLTKLELSGNNFNENTVDALFQYLSNNTQLKRLSLENIGFNSTQLHRLTLILPNTQISNLVLNHNPIGDAAVLELADDIIESGLMNQNDLGEVVLPRGFYREVSDHVKPKTVLEVIEVQNTNINAEAARALCRVNQWVPGLSFVDVGNNNLTESCIATCAFQVIDALAQRYMANNSGHIEGKVNDLSLNNTCHSGQDHILLLTILLSLLTLLFASAAIIVKYPNYFKGGLFSPKKHCDREGCQECSERRPINFSY